MDCSEDLACPLFDWFTSHGYILRQAFAGFDALWNAAGGRITTFFADHGEKLVAATSFAFAAYRWWIYRERILYKRLEEYISESDSRLEPTTSRMFEAILRPGRTPTLMQPAFALELGEIIEARGWRSVFGVKALERQTEKQLRRALIGIRKRERTVENAARSLQKQRAEVHMLKGAIAVSRARNTLRFALVGRNDGQALREFQRALQCPTHRRDAEAKECEAFQFLRLGRLDLAEDAYEQLEDFARDIPDARKRYLITARSKRYRAQILQANAAAGALAALSIIGGGRNPDPSSALAIRQIHAPYQNWDAIEQGEIHYVAAYIASRLNNANLIEQRQLEETRRLLSRGFVEAAKALDLRAESDAASARRSESWL